MRQIIICIIAFISAGMLSCKKENISTEIKSEIQTGVSTNSTIKTTPTSSQLLVRQWIEWVFERDISLDPNLDPTGVKQYADQPLSTGTMMLAGANTPDLVNRSISISYSQYQRIFIPIMFILVWNNSCYTPAPSNGNIPFGGSNSLTSMSLNGNRTVLLKWDNVTMTTSKYALRENSGGTWEFTTHTSWNDGCADTRSTVYADGSWANIPLTVGTHTLEIKGDLFIPRYKIPFSNHVIYTITVTE